MFNVEKTTEAVVEWIRDWFEVNGKGCNAVVGISGGKDSSIVAVLCAKALGKERVIGVLMPNGEQSDIDCSKQLVAHLGIPYYVCNIKKAVDGVLECMETAGIEISRQTRINLPPRIRMSTLYRKTDAWRILATYLRTGLGILPVTATLRVISRLWAS